MKEDTPFSSDRWSGNWLWLRSYHCLNTLKLNSPNLNIVDYEAKMFDLLQQQLDLTNLVHLTESNISSIFNSHCYILNINAIFGKSQFKDSIVWMIYTILSSQISKSYQDNFCDTENYMRTKERHLSFNNNSDRYQRKSTSILLAVFWIGRTKIIATLLQKESQKIYFNDHGCVY